MSQAHVLLVGDDASVEIALKKVVEQIRNCDMLRLPSDVPLPTDLRGFAVVVYTHAASDAETIRRFSNWFREEHAKTPLLVLTQDPSIELRGRLLQQGVVDCLDAEVDAGRLSFLLDLLTVRARQKASEPCSSLSSVGVVDGFLYASPSMQILIKQIGHVASLPVTILLTGETGTGKTHLARTIHELDVRRKGPFVTLDCSALAPSLMESEMFGHVRGAFTGATTDHAGKFEAAGAGTLFLDDVNALPLDLQAKLLRVVEDRCFERLGSNEVRRCKARLIVASNEYLRDLTEEGTFRADLYHRLNVVAFSVPPLRERSEEVLGLAEVFLNASAKEFGVRPPVLSTEVAKTLQQYPWPGNVRELRNAIDRVVALVPQGGTAQIKDLPGDIVDFVESGGVMTESAAARERARGNKLAEARYDAERQRLQDAIRRNNNNRSLAASELGISRVTLYKKMHKYGLI